jgi:hypothetical protein
LEELRDAGAVHFQLEPANPERTEGKLLLTSIALVSCDDPTDPRLPTPGLLTARAPTTIRGPAARYYPTRQDQIRKLGFRKTRTPLSSYVM